MEKTAEAPPASQPELRRAWLRERWNSRQTSEANLYRSALVKWYGDERGKQIKYAEAFEICEFGHQPTEDEIRKLFPFFSETKLSPPGKSPR